MPAEPELIPTPAPALKFTPEEWQAICADVRKIVEANRQYQLKLTGGREPETPEEKFVAGLD